jgi:hypothetical protein
VRQPAGAAAVWAAAAESEPLEEAVGSGAKAVPRPVEAAALDAKARRPAGVAAEGVESDAAAGLLQVVAAAQAVVAERQPAEVAALDAAVRQPAVAAARGVPAVVVFPASAAARLSFPSLFPFPVPSAPEPAGCFAHAWQSLRIASRSERSRQAARDEIWSW